jgi:hypothetical protein
MIKSVRKLKRALKRGDYCGVVLYAGPSRIDGAPVVAIACRIWRLVATRRLAQWCKRLSCAQIFHHMKL